MSAEVEEVESPSTVPAEPAEPTYEFDDVFQKKIVSLALRDTVFARRTDGLVKPAFFESEVDQAIVRIAASYYEKYKTAPDIKSIPTLLRDAVAAKKISKDLIPDLRVRLRDALSLAVTDRDFVIDKVAEFAKHSAIQNALIESARAVSNGDYEKAEKLMRQALATGAQETTVTYDYYDEIDNRTERRRDILRGVITKDGITTGIPELDKHLYHGGWGRGELSAIMARAKFGKSMALGEFAKGASLAGHTVYIATCEVAPMIYADRMDANLSSTAMRLLIDKMFDVQAAIKAASARAGKIIIEGFPSGTLKPSQLRRRLEYFRGQGLRFDLIALDYADIMAPERPSDSPREDSRTIWLDCRAIAQEENAAVLTATQTNRDGAKAMTPKATDVAEDYNKIRTADLVIAGAASDAEIASGEARLYFAASRNQAGEFTVHIQQDREKMKFLTKVLSVSH